MLMCACAQPLEEAGLDSLGAVELLTALGARFGVELRVRVFLDHPSLAALSHHLLTIAAPPKEAITVGAEEVASYASSLSYSPHLQVGSSPNSTSLADILQSASYVAHVPDVQGRREYRLQ